MFIPGKDYSHIHKEALRDSLIGAELSTVTYLRMSIPGAGRLSGCSLTCLSPGGTASTAAEYKSYQ